MQATNGADNVWFVIFERVEKQYQAAGRTDLMDTQNWLAENFTLDQLYRFNDLLVYHYIDGQTDRRTEC